MPAYIWQPHMWYPLRFMVWFTILLPRYSLKGRSTYAATLDPMRPTMGMYEVPQWCIILYSGILWYVL